MTSSELEFGGEVAEPFRFNFEIAWEVANKGRTTYGQVNLHLFTADRSMAASVIQDI